MSIGIAYQGNLLRNDIYLITKNNKTKYEINHKIIPSYGSNANTVSRCVMYKL